LEGVSLKSVWRRGATGTAVSVVGTLLKSLFPSFRVSGDSNANGTLEVSGMPYIVAVKAVKVTEIPKMASGDFSLTVVEPDTLYDEIDRR
jgi:hypothetical protein